MAAEFPPQHVILSQKPFSSEKWAGHKPVLPLLGHVDGVGVGGAVHLLPLKDTKERKGSQNSADCPQKGQGCGRPSRAHLRRVEGGESHRLHHLDLLLSLALQILLCRGDKMKEFGKRRCWDLPKIS